MMGIDVVDLSRLQLFDFVGLPIVEPTNVGQHDVDTLRKIPKNIRRVTPAHLDFTAEAEIAADQHLQSRHQSARQGPVVGNTKTDRKPKTAVIGSIRARPHAKHLLAFTGRCDLFVFYLEPEAR